MIKHKVYIVKNLSFWMVDELKAYSKYTTFKLLLIRRPSNFIGNEISNLGIDVYYLDSFQITFKKIIYILNFVITRIKNFSFDYNFLIGAKSLFWFLKVDLILFKPNTSIHAQFATQATLLSFILKDFLNNGTVYSFTCHAHDIFFNNKWLKLMINGAFKCFTISEYNINYIHEKYNIELNKFILCRLGVYRESFIQEKENNVFTLGFLSWLQEKKGLIYLLNAFNNIILTDSKIDIRLIIAGEGPVKNQLLSFVKENGLSEKVEYLGKIKGVRKKEFFNNIDVFILPAISFDKDMDGLPVVLMEAISYGIPLISTNISGIPEICINNYNGILVNQRSVEELKNAILKLKNEKDLIIKYGTNSLFLSGMYDITNNSKQKLFELGWI